MFEKGITYIDKDINIEVKIKRVTEGELHWHKSIEIIYVFKGLLQINKVDHCYELESGDLYIINSHDIHELKGVENDTVILQANINERLFKKIYGDFYEHVFQCRYIKKLASSSYIREKEKAVLKLKEYLLKIFIINSLLKEELRYKENNFIIKNYKGEVSLYLNYIEKILKNNFEAVKVGEKEVIGEELINRHYKFMRYLSIHYTENITLDDIAKELNLSKFYTSRLLNERAGYGLSEHIKIFRIENGKRLLLLTDKSINNIAMEMGFSNSGAFIKSFKDRYNITPKEYRNKYRISYEMPRIREENNIDYKEILISNLDDLAEFYKNIKKAYDFELEIDSMKINENNRFSLKYNFILNNNLKDIELLINNSALYNFSKVPFNILNSCEVKKSSNTIILEEKFKELLKDITNKKNMIENVLVSSLDNNSLFTEEGVERELYYLYCFFNLLGNQIVMIGKNYIVTLKENGDIAILLYLNKRYNNQEKARINLKWKKNSKIRIYTHIIKVNKKNFKIYREIDKEIKRKLYFPSINIEESSEGDITLNGEVDDIMLIEITKI